MAIVLVHDDCLDYLVGMSPVKTIFVDPPDNIGLKYLDFNDNIDPYDYYNWIELLIQRALCKCKIFWLSYNAKHDVFIKNRLYNLLKHIYPSKEARTFIWRYTFGQYTDRDCPSGYRPILRINAVDATFNMDRIREPSVRMIEGDSRAAGPRIPDDVWEFPRVVGNSAERRSWHPTQHPEALMQRIIKMSCFPNETFVDLCAGTGTSFRAYKTLGHKNVIGVEICKEYCDRIRQENPQIELFKENLPN